MRINNRPKEHYKLPKDTRFKGEQKSLTVRKGTIAKFDQRAAYGYVLSKQKSESHLIKSRTKKKIDQEEKLNLEEPSFSKLEKKGKKLHEKRLSKQSLLTEDESETAGRIAKKKNAKTSTENRKVKRI